MDNDSYNFSFSGIKSYINNFVHNENQRGNEINKEDLACSFQKRVTESLVSKTKKALIDNNIKNLIVAGGVSSNNFIRENLELMAKENGINFNMPKKIYCTDNATMIGAAAYELYIRNIFAGYATNAKSNLKLS